MSEGMTEQVKLESQGQQHPVLEGKLCKKRLPVSKVGNILDSEGIQRSSIDFHLLWLLRLLLVRLLLALLRLLLLRFSLFWLPTVLLSGFLGLLPLLAFLGLRLLFPLLRHLKCSPSAWVLEVLMGSLPRAQHAIPLVVLLAEPIRWLQTLYSLRHLSLQNPLLEVLLTLRLLVPQEGHLIAAFLRRWECELLVGRRHIL
mmetsp:Transcript_2723/g.6407  ORF Transcript_2723/g.6407 Transcript_2723/m.6407 type:complete len:200 (+) Transcript_2723:756-1355(+)